MSVTMLKVVLTLFIIVLALVGMSDSSYITYEKFSGVVPPCGEGFDCGKVLNSSWASIGPLPLSLLGFMYYVSVFILGIIAYLEIDTTTFIKQTSKHVGFVLPNFVPLAPSQLLLALTTIGFGFSLYLIFLMGVIIQAWCFYCLVSAATSTTLFATSLGLWQVEKHA